jgi:hypothetical protein
LNQLIDKYGVSDKQTASAANSGKTAHDDGVIEAKSGSAAPPANASPKPKTAAKRTKVEVKRKRAKKHSDDEESDESFDDEDDDSEDGSSKKRKVSKAKAAPVKKESKKEATESPVKDKKQTPASESKGTNKRDNVAVEANRPIAEAIVEMASLYFKGGDPRKGGVFSKAAKAIREADFQISTAKQAMSLKGVGKGIAGYIEEKLTTGEIVRLEELRAGK